MMELRQSAAASACGALRPAPAVRCGGEAGACGGALRHAPAAQRCCRHLRSAAAGVCVRPAPAVERCSSSAGACGALRRCGRRR